MAAKFGRSKKPAPAAKPIEQRLNDALALHQVGELDKARRIYREILERVPGHADALNLSGLVHLEKGEGDHALGFFEKAIAVAPDNPFHHANRADALVAVGRAVDALASQAKAVELQPEHPPFLAGLARILKVAGRPADALAAYREALSRAPEDGGLAFEIADLLAAEGFHAESLAALRHVLAVDPGHIEAAVLIADRLTQDGDTAGALNALAGLDPRQPIVALARANAHLKARAYEDAERALQPALELTRGGETLKTAALHLKGKIEFDTDRFTQAVATLSEARRRAPRDAEIGYMLGFAAIAAGRLDIAWPLYDLRFRARVKEVVQRNLDQPVWDGSPAPGKTLLLWSDQGVGDVFRSASMFREIADRFDKVVIECGPKNLPVLKRCFPDLDIRPNRADRLTGKSLSTDADLNLPMGSLPRYLRPTLAAFEGAPATWITPDPDRVAALRATGHFDDPRPLVGLIWRPFRPSPRTAHLYIGLEALAPLIARGDCRFVVLQYGDVTGDLAAFREKTGLDILHLPDVEIFDDLENAAALTSLTDIVISPNSSSADIAAALGRPVLRYGTSQSPTLLGAPSQPWYPATRYLHVPYDQTAESLTPDLTRLFDEMLAGLRKN